MIYDEIQGVLPAQLIRSPIGRGKSAAPLVVFR